MAGKIRLLVKTSMRGIAAGTVIEVPAKPDGSPAELFWRRRLRDATRPEGGDGCVAILSDPAVSGTLAASEAATAAGSE